MKSKKILINASNLHVGGGVQVAADFISYLSKKPDIAKDYDLVVSDKVYSNLDKRCWDASIFASFLVFNSSASPFSLFKQCILFSKAEIIFNIFGPVYFCSNAIQLVGFAQPWIIYPDNELYKKMGLPEKIIKRLKFQVQKIFFSRYDALIVELDHVRNRIKYLEFFSKKIFVVRNCFSAIFRNSDCWENIDFDVRGDCLRIGFLGRNYSHKNTSVIPYVKDLLLNKYGRKVDFYVTFSDEEWSVCNDFFRDNVINVGVLNVKQCPTFLKKMDGVIAPSILECFSATPLEAMIMERPVFLSDREFNRDVCGEWGNYFDPLSIDSIAASIDNYYSSIDDRKGYLLSAKKHAMEFSSSEGRALKYIDIINFYKG